jgi:hypothetical protein
MIFHIKTRFREAGNLPAMPNFLVTHRNVSLAKKGFVMFWDLMWSAVLPSMIFFIFGMMLLALFVRYDEARRRKLAPTKKKAY